MAEIASELLQLFASTRGTADADLIQHCCEHIGLKRALDTHDTDNAEHELLALIYDASVETLFDAKPLTLAGARAVALVAQAETDADGYGAGPDLARALAEHLAGLAATA